jgi:hypothetical protein
MVKAHCQIIAQQELFRVWFFLVAIIRPLLRLFAAVILEIEWDCEQINSV